MPTRSKNVTQPLTMSEFQGYFSESPDPIIKAKYVPDTIIWQWGIRSTGELSQLRADRRSGAGGA